MNRIRELRKQMNMTQKELAKQLQIADSTLSYWEMGKYEPDSNALLALSRFFNVPIDYILRGDFEKWEVDGEKVQYPNIVPQKTTDSDIYVSEPIVAYKKGVQSTVTSSITSDPHMTNSAFNRIEFNDLTQKEIEQLAEYAAYIKFRRKSE